MPCLHLKERRDNHKTIPKLDGALCVSYRIYLSSCLTHFGFLFVIVFLNRDEQYKALWSELEAFLRAHADVSVNHQNVLDCFLECTGRGNTNKSFAKSPKNGDDKRCVIIF